MRLTGIDGLDGGGLARLNASTDVGVVEVVTLRERVHVVARGEIDIATAPGLQAAVEDVVRRGSPDVLVDLREVSFIDIVGVHALDAANRFAARADVHALFLACDRVWRVLAMTGALARLDVQVAPARERFKGDAPAARLPRRLRPVD